MTRERLAELIGVSLTTRTREAGTFTYDAAGRVSGIRVRKLADAVASDIFDQLQEGEGQ